MSTDDAAPAPHPGLSFGAFVAMMASFMALNGLAVDTMLPALPAIGAELGVTDPNSRQWVITAYFLGFGLFQLIYGPLSDRYGRRPVVLAGLSVYGLFSLATVFVSTFDAVVVTRFLQGAGSAATRVLVIAIVRDCYSGRRMARVMSLSFIIFLIVPVVAPALGQGLMLFVSWHWIFLGLALFALCLTVWAWYRLPETLAVKDRLPLKPERVIHAIRTVSTIRQSIGYTVAMTLVLSPLFGYINSVQQVFADVFGVPQLFATYFAVTAISMAIASYVNSRIVERLGTRLVSHTALCAMLLVSLFELMLMHTSLQSLFSFVMIQCVIMFCFGLTAPNFGAMAMEPVGHIAGTASSVQGCVTTVGAAVIGFMIGQSFDGTAVPLITGFTLCAASALVVVLLTEGRLFTPLHEPA